MKKILGVLCATGMITFFTTSSYADLTVTNNTGNPALDVFKDTVYDQLKDDWDQLDKLCNGMANANAYASQTTTFMGYQGYDSFAVSVGGMLGGQLPSIGGLDSLESGNAFVGVSTAVALNVGINGSIIGLDNWYINVKGLGFSLAPKFDDVDTDISSFAMGVGLSYQLATPYSIPGVIKWRGLYVSTGITYNSTEASITTKGFEVTDPTSTYSMDSTVTYKSNNSIFTIPVEVSTSIRLLWIVNFALGAGVDFNFGNTDISINNSNDVIDASDISQGNFNIRTSDGSSPTFMDAHLMASLGFGFGPVYVDVPAAIYFPIGVGPDTGIGFNLGLSVGMIW